MSKLLNKTRALLLESNETIPSIAKAVGCSRVTIQLIKTQNKHIPNVALVERLYEHLSGKQLEV